MLIEGRWYPARSSRNTLGRMELACDSFRLLTADPPLGADLATPAFTEAASGSMKELSISDRVGDTSRRIHLADGSQFETFDNASIDSWLRSGKHPSRRSLGIHRLESTWRMVAVALVVTMASVFSAFYWGLPVAATRIADAMPVSAHELISKGTLKSLDRFILNASGLDKAEQDGIRQRFTALVAAVPDDGFEFSLHFRTMRDIPNAFALPGGDIIVTDALVKLVQVPDELDSILLHEIGHVMERHGMRHVVEASTVSLVASLALGDLGGLGQLAAGVPVFLLQSRYSRSSESEADEFAFARMLELNKDPKHFAAIMRRLEAAYSDAEPISVKTNEEKSGSNSSKPAPDWFSTHPDSERRALRAMEVSRKQGL